MRARRKALGVKRDNALITFHVSALINGEREISLAQQIGRRCSARSDAGGDTFLVHLRIAAQTPVGMVAVGCFKISDQHMHRPLALRLEGKAPFKFER